MKLSISNIGWSAENDAYIYELMAEYGYKGLEIAPTRFFPENPYDKADEMTKLVSQLNSRYGFVIPSMQSIWYGRGENFFGSKEEYDSLIDYSEKAILFANAAGCKNLVFGCPRNRNIPDGADSATGERFFGQLAEIAKRNGTVIGMEANPPIYNTNYINDTLSAVALIEKIGSKGFGLNLDTGTMIYNEENAGILRGKVKYVSHVHISEPGLKPIERRKLHGELKEVLSEEGYDGFVSIEMGRQDNLDIIKWTMEYVKEIFG